MKKFAFIGTFLILLTVFAVPFQASAAYQPGFELRSNTAILYNLDSKTIVFEKDADKPMEPASLTKVMTAIIAMEQVKDLDGTTVTAKRKIFDEIFGTNSSNAGILLGETLSMRELLHCLLVQSANEAAGIIADYIGDGDTAKFCQMMNDKAKEIGATNTKFVNASGLPAEGHYTTCRDMMKITLYALDLPGFSDMVNQTRHTVPPTNLSKQRILVTTNKMMDPVLGGQYYMREVKGVKTGYTSTAGNCLISTATKNGYNYLLVTMWAPSRDASGKLLDNGAFLDAKQLYNWAFDTFRIKQAVRTEEPVCQVKLGLSWSKDHLLLVPETSVQALIPKDIESTSIQIVPNVPKSVDAPIKKGQVIGTASLRLAGNEIGTVNLISNEEVDRNQLLFFGKMIATLFGSIWFKIVAAIVVLLVVSYFVLILVYNNKRRKIKRVRPRRRL